jgi:hypothetical protein
MTRAIRKGVVCLAVLGLTSILLATLSGCGDGIIQPVQPIKWFIVLDATYSVPAHAFALYKDELTRDSVLCRMRTREEICVIAMDNDPTDDVYDEIYDRIKRIRRRPEEQKGTNFGAVLRFLKERIDIDLANKERLAKQGRSTPDYKYVVVVLTDGYADGWQVERIGAFPSAVEVRILFGGINPPIVAEGEEPTEEQLKEQERRKRELQWRHPEVQGDDMNQLVMKDFQDNVDRWDLAGVDVQTRLWGHNATWPKNFLDDLRRDQNETALASLKPE